MRPNPGDIRFKGNTASLRGNRLIHPRRNVSTRPSPETQHRPLDPSNPFYIPKPDSTEFPPISQRLKPLLPFIFYWTVLTSLAYHLLRMRTLKKEETARKEAQISVLEGLVNRYRAAKGIKTGTELDEQVVYWPDEAEVQRELEMVGLRERKHIPGTDEGVDGFEEARSVGWKEVLFGRKRVKLTEEEEAQAAEKEWRDVVNAAAESSKVPATQSTRSPVHPSNIEPTSQGIEMSSPKTRRAPSSAVFM
ncbi:hypothetical protein NCC49_000357 [Naganishia albida]|nr:hypothetical protein NCC49_000357 [Naganishia albida]